MSVYVTLRLQVDPAVFEAAAKDHAEAIDRVMENAKGNGLIGHRWMRGDGEVMAIDEWPAAENFQTFFESSGPDIGPFLASAGVTSEPEVTVWGQVDIADLYGWGA